MVLGRLVLGAFLTAAVAVPSELAIVVDPQGELPGAVLRSMQAEFESIIRIQDLTIQWRILDDEPMRDVFERMIVVRLNGACVAAPIQARFSASTPTLGLTHVSDGEILPFTTIECERVRSLIQPAVWSMKRSDRELALGRALARVLAHETYHIICRTQKHTRSGIARSHFTTADLTDDELHLIGDSLACFASALGSPLEPLETQQAMTSQSLDD